MDKKCIEVRRFIFTGTPGSGKTSVIKKLEKSGYAVIYEAATDVISTEQAKGLERPWEEPNFVDQITRMQKKRQMDAQRHCEHSEAIQNNTGSPQSHALLRDDVQFYDRLPFCTYALGRFYSNSPVS